MQKVRFSNSRGQDLAGWLHLGSGRRDPGPTVLLCHGMMSTKDGRKQVALAEALEESGFSVLRFDFSFCGESGGRFEEITFTQEVDDLRCAAGWARRNGASRVGLIGSSMGGAVAILYAREDPAVKALVTMAAVARPARLADRMEDLEAKMAQWRQEGYTFGAEGAAGRAFFEDVQRLDVLAAARNVSAPMLIIHGAGDEVVPVEEAHSLYQAATAVKCLKILPEADHRFTREEHLREIVVSTRTWFQRYL
ncbi:MAG: alpha/beta fold hydrolase [bacterium]